MYFNKYNVAPPRVCARLIGTPRVLVYLPAKVFQSRYVDTVSLHLPQDSWCSRQESFTLHIKLAFVVSDKILPSSPPPAEMVMWVEWRREVWVRLREPGSVVEVFVFLCVRA